MAAISETRRCRASVAGRLERDSKPTVSLQWERLCSGERFDPWRRGGIYREAILTAIDKAIVVRLESLVSIAFLSEGDGGDTLRATCGVITQENLLDGTNGLIEEVLKKCQTRLSSSSRRGLPTLIWASFTSGGRFDTIILSALPPSGAGAATAAARARCPGGGAGLPRTCARAATLAEPRRLERRTPLGLEAMI